MKKEFTTPKEILTYIRDVYASCDTFDEIKEKGLDEYICTSVSFCFKDNIDNSDLISRTKNIILHNRKLSFIESDLVIKYDSCFWTVSYSIIQNREKECINLKVDFLNKLIETL